jgi:signal peptidase II
MATRSRARVFWPVLLAVTAVDAVTKALARRWLPLPQLPHDVLGNAVRFTLVYNPGAAFGINFGPSSRWIFTALTVVALVILARLYAATRSGDMPRTVALALVCGGALGNLVDRLSSGMGVVDFIDVGLRNTRWPTFNVADIAVCVGAVLLAVVLWAEDRAAAEPVSAALAGSAPMGEHPAGEAT